MLELEIKALKEEVTTLREVMTQLIMTLNEETPLAKYKATKAEQAEAPKEKTKDKPKVEDVVTEEATVTREELQEICTGIIRDDRSKKDDIKEAIASFDDATNLRAVDDKDLSSLKAKLLELQ